MEAFTGTRTDDDDGFTIKFHYKLSDYDDLLLIKQIDFYSGILMHFLTEFV